MRAALLFRVGQADEQARPGRLLPLGSGQFPVGVLFTGLAVHLYPGGSARPC
jgi:hypothetical protein